MLQLPKNIKLTVPEIEQPPTAIVARLILGTLIYNIMLPYIKGVKSQDQKKWRQFLKESSERIKEKKTKEQLRKNQIKAKEFSLELIKNATSYELKFKKILENQGYIFEFQKPIFDHNKIYIVDFYLVRKDGRKGIVIELDGKHHNNTKQKEYDQKRTQFLKKHHCIVLRYSNKYVMRKSQNILRQLDNMRAAKV